MILYYELLILHFLAILFFIASSIIIIIVEMRTDSYLMTIVLYWIPRVLTMIGFSYLLYSLVIMIFLPIYIVIGIIVTLAVVFSVLLVVKIYEWRKIKPYIEEIDQKFREIDSKLKDK